MSDKKMQVVIDGYPFAAHRTVTEFVSQVARGLTIVSVAPYAVSGRVHVVLVLTGTEDQVEAHHARLRAEMPDMAGSYLNQREKPEHAAVHYEDALVQRVAKWAYEEWAVRTHGDTIDWENANQSEWLDGARGAIRGES